MITTAKIYSFGQLQNGRLVAKFRRKNASYDEFGYAVDDLYEVVFCRNPYGSHNLVVACNGEAFCHGNGASLAMAERLSDAVEAKKLLRKVRRFLGKRAMMRRALDEESK